MPYTKNVWVDLAPPDVDAANLNHMEAGIAAAPYGPDGSLGFVPVGDGSGAWVYKKLTNAEIDPAAAIAYAKLALSGSIVNADVAAAAAIALTKLNIPNDATKFARGDGTWASAPGAAANTAVNIGSTPTDLASPSGIVNYFVVTTGGGTLRSIGAGVSAGARITFVNSTTSFVALTHQDGAATGAKLYIQNAGNRYLAPGQTIRFVYDGTNWVEVERPPVETICDLLLSGTQASFDTNTILGGNIPQVYTHLHLMLLGRSNNATVTDIALLRANNDSGANYDDLVMQDTGTANQNTESLGVAGLSLHAQVPAASATAAYAGQVTADILGYAQTTFNKFVTVQAASRDSTTAGHGTNNIQSGLWRNNVAITRLTALLNSGGSWVAGSRLTIQGVTA